MREHDFIGAAQVASRETSEAIYEKQEQTRKRI